jgi:hypothetical protein
VNAFSPSSINSGAQGLRRKALIVVLPLILWWIIIRAAHMNSNECCNRLTTNFPSPGNITCSVPSLRRNYEKLPEPVTVVVEVFQTIV